MKKIKPIYLILLGIAVILFSQSSFANWLPQSDFSKCSVQSGCSNITVYSTERSCLKNAQRCHEITGNNPVYSKPQRVQVDDPEKPIYSRTKIQAGLADREECNALNEPVLVDPTCDPETQECEVKTYCTDEPGNFVCEKQEDDTYQASCREHKGYEQKQVWRLREDAQKKQAWQDKRDQARQKREQRKQRIKELKNKSSMTNQEIQEAVKLLLERSGG